MSSGTLGGFVSLSSSCCRRLKIADLNDESMIASLKHRNVKWHVWAATAAQPPTIAVKRGLNIFGSDVWLMFLKTWWCDRCECLTSVRNFVEMAMKFVESLFVVVREDHVYIRYDPIHCSRATSCAELVSEMQRDAHC